MLFKMFRPQRQLKDPLFLGILKKAVNSVLVLQILTDFSDFLDQQNVAGDVVELMRLGHKKPYSY